ncbi:MAG TPA: AbrB/MazE/SpoVT family DNA-binding domain-containing protein [Vicinamibacterales bacterium]|nr:AbrB/MazE/SpoVT family DNA-binding domain-containing protein [Vicinamibacterales bacterium]
MITTIDGAGRLVLPKAARDRARLVPGMPLEVRVVDGRIEIEPAPARVTVEKRSGFWVAQPADSVPVLSHDTVERAIEELREPLDPAASAD